jgi:hypothetical protein
VSELEPLHPDAAFLSAFRVLKNGGCRAYSTVEFERGRDGVARTLRVASCFGFVENYIDGAESYAMLDVLDEDCGEVQEFNIPSAGAFRWWKGKLRLRVVSEDPPPRNHS